MRWSTLGFAAVAGCLSSAALADGMPRRAMAYEAPFSWTGFYIGINGGYSWGRADTGVSASATERTRVFQAFQTPAQTLISDATVGAAAAFDGAADVDGWIGGGQVGINMQANRFVFGFEADLQWSGERGSQSFCTLAACGVGSGFLNASHDQDWFGTLRVRAGALLDPRFLVYATAGVAYSHFSNDYAAGVVGTPIPPIVFSESKGKGGWVVGGGAEWALHRNLSMKAEYLYIDYGTIGSGAVAAAGQTVIPNLPGAGLTTVIDAASEGSLRTRFTDQVFRLGLNYRFGPREPERVPLK